MASILSTFEVSKKTCILLSALLLLAGNLLFAQHPNKINYFDQNPPGDVAKLFAPGIISTNGYEHSSPAFSPDGNVVLWTVVNKDYRASMLEMKYDKGQWSAPYRPSFADSTADDYYPSFSPDGKKLYFSSRRQAPKGYTPTADMRIWEVERHGNSWGSAEPFDTTVSKGSDYAHSITKNGTIYFSGSMGGGTNFNINRSAKINERYTTPSLLPYSINSVDYEDGPYISPDESFLIFESIRPEGIDGSIDLYISFKNINGQWGLPINLGPKINSPASERFAKLSPDGRFLFFGSSRNQSADNWGFDIFWIDAKVINELRPSTAKQNLIEPQPGDDLIHALHNNDIEQSYLLLKQWIGLYPNSLDGIILYSSFLRKQGHFSEAEKLLLSNSIKWNVNTGFIMETALVKLGLKKSDEAAALLVPILIDGEQQRERYKYLSNALLDMKMYKESDFYFEKAMTINANWFEYHRRARRYALIGEKDKAFYNLDKAVQLGQTSKQEFENDEELKALKPDERWKMLTEKLKQQ